MPCASFYALPSTPLPVFVDRNLRDDWQDEVVGPTAMVTAVARPY